jgi:5-formyltetrahydrofolate cyclo-ligase
MAPPISEGSRGKVATRRSLLACRDGLTVEERVDAGAQIAARVNRLLGERLAPGSIIALYAAKGSEVETALIDVAARKAGFRVVYPRVIEDDRVLAFHEVQRDELVSSTYALMEPRAEMPRVSVSDIAAFVVPGLAFDREGGRVGWGRGHYDATFAVARPDALRVGLAFACQLVERVPREAHDALVHYVVTEDATHAV